MKDPGRVVNVFSRPAGAFAGTVGGFSVAVNYPKVEDAKRAYDTLSKGGKVSMAMGKTFWVEAFGMVADRFGTPWMISGGKASV